MTSKTDSTKEQPNNWTQGGQAKSSDAAALAKFLASQAPRGDAAVAAIQFAIRGEEGLAFLRCWIEGDFDAIRNEWPEAPEEVFIGADPLHKPSK